MSSTPRQQLTGAPASPYTRKMLALLRYRRIPYNMMWVDPQHLEQRQLPKPKVPLHPTFFFPTEAGELEAVVDSTPIIRRLEAMHEGRSVIPEDPALSFIDYLFEDFADEFCTKYMFHYRWYYDADIDKAGTLLPLCMDPTLDPNTHAMAKKTFSDRQIGRLHVVGSNEVTAAVIEASFKRLLGLLENHFQELPYLLGRRPGACDYALFGQLTQLVGFDPTPAALALEISPRTCAWVSIMEDLSGLEPQNTDWISADAPPQSLLALLGEVGKVYVPALLANARALMAGEASWETEIDGRPWKQQTFPYQGKCLQWINDTYRSLAADDRARVDKLLSGTGCEALLVSAE